MQGVVVVVMYTHMAGVITGTYLSKFIPGHCFYKLSRVCAVLQMFFIRVELSVRVTSSANQVIPFCQ